MQYSFAVLPVLAASALAFPLFQLRSPIPPPEQLPSSLQHTPSGHFGPQATKLPGDGPYNLGEHSRHGYPTGTAGAPGPTGTGVWPPAIPTGTGVWPPPIPSGTGSSVPGSTGTGYPYQSPPINPNGRP